MVEADEEEEDCDWLTSMRCRRRASRRRCSMVRSSVHLETDGGAGDVEMAEEDG